jgi:hypothetical protein
LGPVKREKSNDLFIEKMKNVGAIENAVFSFSIGTLNTQSKVTFGGYDDSKFATDKIKWHSVQPGYEW